MVSKSGKLGGAAVETFIAGSVGAPRRSCRGVAEYALPTGGIAAMRMSPPLRIAGVYVLFAAIWIWCSDRALDALVPDVGLRMELQTLKGWVFVLVTGAMLYWMIRKDVRRLQLGNRRLRQGREQALRVLVTAMDVRHQETGHHFARAATAATEVTTLAGARGRDVAGPRFSTMPPTTVKLARGEN